MTPKTLIPRLILTLVGVLLIVAPFITSPGQDTRQPWSRLFAYIDENFSVWFNILAVFAFILGAASLLRTHGRRVVEHGRDWPYSLLTLFSFVAVLVIGLLKVGGPPGLQGNVTHAHSWLTWIYQAIYTPLRGTIYALLAFFVASAAYRAFRLRSVETSLLLGAAFVVLLGRTPFGVTLTAWLPDRLHALRIDELSVWILKVPVTAGWRAVLIGIALGVVAMSLRLILGLERQALGGNKS
jgi:hypothetical protein